MSSQKAVNVSAIILSVVVVGHGGMWSFTSQTKCETGWPRKPLSSSPGTLQHVLLYTVPPAVAHSENQALKENLCQPGAQHGPIYPASQAGSTLLCKSCSGTASCCQYPGSHLTVPRGDVCAVLCCGVGWGWDGDKCWGVSPTHWLEKKSSPSEFCFTSLPASSGDILSFPWHCSAGQGSCSVIPVW